MANASILAAFERMWQHVVVALNNKSDIDHTHNPSIVTQSEPPTDTSVLWIDIDDNTVDDNIGTSGKDGVGIDSITITGV